MFIGKIILMNSKPCLILTIILISIALLASISLNIYLFTWGKTFYSQLNQTRLDPLGLNHYPSSINQSLITSTHQISVLFFGDSRAAGWPSPPGSADFNFINRGIGAQTSTQVLQRFEAHVKPLHPQIIIVQVGINDLKTIPLFPHQKEMIITTCQKNIQEIVARSVERGATVILTTIFPVGEVPLQRKLFWSDEVPQAVAEVNAYIHTLQGEKVILLDAYAILADKEGMIREEYAQNELHLNLTGYEALNNELAEVLADLYQHHN
jgi:lysophospholipase L1-like esterase